MEELRLILNNIISFVPSENFGPLINMNFLALLFIMFALEIGTRFKDFPLSRIENYLNRPTRWIIYYIFIFLIFHYAGPKEDFIYFQF